MKFWLWKILLGMWWICGNFFVLHGRIRIFYGYVGHVWIFDGYGYVWIFSWWLFWICRKFFYCVWLWEKFGSCVWTCEKFLIAVTFLVGALIFFFFGWEVFDMWFWSWKFFFGHVILVMEKWAKFLCCRASRFKVVSKYWIAYGKHCLLPSGISSMMRASVISLNLY